MQAAKREFPFPLPNGWFTVAYSNEVAPGQVVPLRYFATDLVLFRSEARRGARARRLLPASGREHRPRRQGRG